MRFLLSLAVALLLACLASAAPLPFAKPSPPASPEPAVYHCGWHGTSFDVRLYPGGRYECRRMAGGPAGPPEWTGTWTQDGQTLNVCEKTAGWTCRWSVGPDGPVIDGKPADVWLERVR